VSAAAEKSQESNRVHGITGFPVDDILAGDNRVGTDNKQLPDNKTTIIETLKKTLLGLLIAIQ